MKTSPPAAAGTTRRCRPMASAAVMIAALLFCLSCHHRIYDFLDRDEFYTLTYSAGNHGCLECPTRAKAYHYGAEVTLKPMPDAGYYFGGWSGPDGPNMYLDGSDWKIQMDANKTVTATFTLSPSYALSVDVEGNGTVTAGPTGWVYEAGTRVTLTPVPGAPDSAFSGWSGANASEVANNGDGTYSIVVNEAKRLTATFRSTAAGLSALTISGGIPGLSFQPGITEYNVNVPNSVTAITVSGTSSDSGASVSANNGVPQPLAEGANVITIRVTAQDGVTAKDYTVTVNRFGADYVSPAIGIKMRFVPAGTFQRNPTPTATSAVSAFRMSECEITRANFAAVMGVDPCDPGADYYSSGTSDPVQMVKWYDAIAFCNKLSLAEGLTPVYTVTVGGTNVNFATLAYADIPTVHDANWFAAAVDSTANGYRLPTELEWVWAFMGATSDRSNGYSGAGTNTTGYAKGYAGSTETVGAQTRIAEYAWCGDVMLAGTTHPVGSKKPNELGLYDMSGSVWEWCRDGDGTATSRIIRGGCWRAEARFCAAFFNGGAVRGSMGAFDRGEQTGFRVVRR